MEMNATHPMTGYVHGMYALHAIAGLDRHHFWRHYHWGLRVRPAIDHRHHHELPAPRRGTRAAGSTRTFEWQRRTFLELGGNRSLHLRPGLRAVDFWRREPGVDPLTGGAGAPGAGAGCSVGAWLALVFGALIAGVWILYRVIRGWMALGSGKAMNV